MKKTQIAAIFLAATSLALSSCNLLGGSKSSGKKKKTSSGSITSVTSGSGDSSSSGEQPVDVILSSIAVSGQQTTYYVGDSFVKPTVTATYSDSSTKNVTNSASFSGYNLSSAGSQTVKVSYTEGAITKETSYSITVKAAAWDETTQNLMRQYLDNEVLPFAKGSWTWAVDSYYEAFVGKSSEENFPNSYLNYGNDWTKVFSKDEESGEVEAFYAAKAHTGGYLQVSAYVDQEIDWDAWELVGDPYTLVAPSYVAEVSAWSETAIASMVADYGEVMPYPGGTWSELEWDDYYQCYSSSTIHSFNVTTITKAFTDAGYIAGQVEVEGEIYNEFMKPVNGKFIVVDYYETELGIGWLDAYLETEAPFGDYTYEIAASSLKALVGDEITITLTKGSDITYSTLFSASPQESVQFISATETTTTCKILAPGDITITATTGEFVASVTIKAYDEYPTEWEEEDAKTMSDNLAGGTVLPFTIDADSVEWDDYNNKLFITGGTVNAEATQAYYEALIADGYTGVTTGYEESYGYYAAEKFVYENEVIVGCVSVAVAKVDSEGYITQEDGTLTIVANDPYLYTWSGLDSAFAEYVNDLEFKGSGSIPEITSQAYDIYSDTDEDKVDYIVVCAIGTTETETSYGEKLVAAGYTLDEETGFYNKESSYSIFLVEQADSLNVIVYDFNGEVPPSVETLEVVFATAGSDSSTSYSDSNALESIAEGASAFSSASNVAKVYKGKSGLKFGTTSATGSITLNLAEATYVESILINTTKYGSENGNLKVYVNGDDTNSVTLTATDSKSLTVNDEVTSITFESSSKRIYLTSFTINPQ